MKHLLAVDDLAALDTSGAVEPSLRVGIETMLDLTASFVEVTQRDIPKVPAFTTPVMPTPISDLSKKQNIDL